MAAVALVTSGAVAQTPPEVEWLSAAGSWATAGSWAGGAVPGTGSVAAFGTALTGAGPVTVTMDGDRTVAGLKVSAAADLTLDNGSTANDSFWNLSLGAAGIDVSGQSALTLRPSATSLTASQTWTVGAGSRLTVTGVNWGAA